MNGVHAKTESRFGLFEAWQPGHEPIHGQCGGNENAKFFAIGVAASHFVQSKLYRLHGRGHCLGQPAPGYSHLRLATTARE